MALHAFERSLQRDIPVSVSAGFLYRLKHAGWVDAPDESGTLEGQFAAPLEQVLLKLTEVISAKFKLMVAYHIYAESMRGVAQHAVGEVFHEHAEQERAAAEAYLKRAAVLGGGPIHLPEIETPPASSDPVGILMTIVRQEQEAIALQTELKAMVGETNPLAFQIEQYMIEDQHHHDEAWQMLPQDVARAGLVDQPPAASQPALEPPPAAGAPAPAPAKTDKPPAPSEKEASVRFLAALKKLGYSGPAEPGFGNDPAAAPTPTNEPMTVPVGSMEMPGEQPMMANPPGSQQQLSPVNYLEAEETARRAQEGNEADFYRGQAQDAQGQVQSMGQQVQQIQSQLDQLSAQAAESQNQIMAANQQAQTANDQMLTHATLAARMRMGMQQLRAQMMEIASQDPEQLAAAAGGPTPMDVGNQAQAGAAPPGDPSTGLNGEAAVTADPSGGAGAQGQPTTPDGAPSAGAAPGAVPGGQGSPDAGGGESAPSEPQNASGGGDKKDGAETTVSIKKGSAKTGSMADDVRRVLPAMAVGGAVGAGKSYLDAKNGKGIPELQDQVDVLQGQQREGDFGKALELAKTQATMAKAEDARAHPVRAALGGGLAGAGAGAGLAMAIPAAISGGKRLAQNIQTYRNM